MQTYLDNWWTNREEALELFEKIVNGDDPHRILLLTADQGFGKSWVIEKMEKWCIDKHILYTRSDFDKSHDEVTISPEVILARAFYAFPGAKIAPENREITTRIKVDITGNPGSVKVAEKAEILNPSFSGDIAGVIVKGNTINAPGDGDAIAIKRLRDIKILRDTLTASTPKPFVWLVDTCDKADPDTSDWLCGGILRRIANGELPIIIVLSGQPDFPHKLKTGKGIDIKSEWGHAIRRINLEPFDENTVKYLCERTGLPFNRELLVYIYSQTGGVPQQLVAAIETYARHIGYQLWQN